MSGTIVDIEFEQVDDRDLQAGRPDVGGCAPALFVLFALAAWVIIALVVLELAVAQ